MNLIGLRKIRQRLGYSCAWILLRPVTIFTQVIGRKNIPRNRHPYIIVANHISELDPVKIAMMFPLNNPVHWFTKYEAFHIKEIVKDYQYLGIFKWFVAVFVTLFVRNTFTIPVDRISVTSKINRKAVRTALEILRGGGIVGIFGEGGIKRAGNAHPVFINLAQKTGAAIIPVKVYESSFKKITFGKHILKDDQLFKSANSQDSQKQAQQVMDLIWSM